MQLPGLLMLPHEDKPALAVQSASEVSDPGVRIERALLQASQLNLYEFQRVLHSRYLVTYGMVQVGAGRGRALPPVRATRAESSGPTSCEALQDKGMG